MRLLGLAALCALLPVFLPAGGTAAGQGAPITFTVHVMGRATRTALRLQPGFATVLRADHRVETVAIGDPRVVTATTVKRGQDVFDLVLQPQTATGATNMIVWYGDLTSIWDLTIGPGARTADIVYVITASPAAEQSTPGVLRAAADESYLEIQQTLPEAQGVFQLFRERSGIKIRYRITNTGGSTLTVRPSGVLVRTNGRITPFAMSRSSADTNRPALLAPGSTETGAIGTTVKAPRQVELVFSLFPVEDGRRGANRAVPATFQLTFSGLDRLAGSSAL